MVKAEMKARKTNVGTIGDGPARTKLKFVNTIKIRSTRTAK